MPCYHPIEVPIRRKSIYQQRRLLDWQVVPCGTCIGCRAEQGRQWAVRMMHEARMHTSNLFVTLTYSEEELPEDGTLHPAHLTRFVKDLRKTAPQGRFSFFACGEYGERTQRPHYHALLFGPKLLDRDFGFDSARPSIWRSKTLEDIWGRGITEGGSVTMASASYVAGYIRKKVKTRAYVRANPVNGVLLAPEFSRMSLRPAIAKRWIEKHWRDVYPRDFVVIDGVEAKPPRYYDKWMDQYHDRSKYCVGGLFCHLHQEVMEQVRQTRMDEAVQLTKQQLASGEIIHKSRIDLFQRRDRI